MALLLPTAGPCSMSAALRPTGVACNSPAAGAVDDAAVAADAAVRLYVDEREVVREAVCAPYTGSCGCGCHAPIRGTGMPGCSAAVESPPAPLPSNPRPLLLLGAAAVGAVGAGTKEGGGTAAVAAAAGPAGVAAAAAAAADARSVGALPLCWAQLARASCQPPGAPGRRAGKAGKEHS